MKKIRVKLKILLALTIMIIAICVFNTKKVNAVEVTEDYLQKILDLVPDTMNLDIKEIEYEKAPDIIRTNIENILEKENIKYEVSDQYTQLGEQTINKGDIILQDLTFNNNIVIIDSSEITTLWPGQCRTGYVSIRDGKYNVAKEKKIKLIYNNSKDYNKKDEEYVKNLKIENTGYFEIKYEDLLKTKWFEENENYHLIAWYEVLELAEKYYTNQIKDKTITVKAHSEAGNWSEMNVIYGDEGLCIDIYKNGVFYESRNMGRNNQGNNKSTVGIPTITVPNTVTDNEIKEYIINLLKPKFEKSKIMQELYGEKLKTLDIVKGMEDTYYEFENTIIKDVPDIYTVMYNEYKDSVIIIRREKTSDEISTVTITDNKTDVKLDTTSNIVPKDTILEVESIEKGDTYDKVNETLGKKINKFVLFDINLKSNGVKIQPNAKVKISIPVPNEFNTSKLFVYRIDDNTKVKYNAKIEKINNKKYVTFETDHFSLYVVAEEEIIDTKLIEETSKVENNKLDDTPKTGEREELINIISLVAIISLVGIVVVLNRKK